MPTVYEQLQKYRALHASNTAALLAKHPSVSAFTHPKTKEYFKQLMQRWHNSSANNNSYSNASNDE